MTETGSSNQPPEGLLNPLPVADAPRFPTGFWRGVDYLLMNRNDVLDFLSENRETGRMIRFFLIACILLGSVYGGVMGATNLCQGSDLELKHKLMMIVVSAIKVPVLFLLSLIIVFPPLYVSNAFVGAKLAFSRMVAVMLASLGMQIILLSSMATVALFFALTTRSYDFIKLMHVAFFAYGGLAGIVFLTRAIRHMAGAAGRATPMLLFMSWLILYGFVGIQLAWTLRPFVGSPDEPFQLFREHRGNFVESTFYSMGKLLMPESQETNRRSREDD